MPLTSNLSVHACPLASDSKAARVRHPRYSRVNIRAYASAICVTHVCARVTSTRSTCERVWIASIPRPLPPQKKVEGLGTRLACPLHMNLVHAFERECVRFRVLARVPACACASTRVCMFEYSHATRARHTRAVKLLVSGTVPYSHEPTSHSNIFGSMPPWGFGSIFPKGILEVGWCWQNLHRNN